jgi:hypothetical protein
MNVFSTAQIKRVKLTVSGKHSLECFQKGLATLPLVPEGKPVKRGMTLVVDEAHVSWAMPRISQGLPAPFESVELPQVQGLNIMWSPDLEHLTIANLSPSLPSIFTTVCPFTNEV